MIKWISSVAIAVACFCLLARYILNYWVGYYDGSILPLACRDLWMPFIGLIACLVIVITWLLSLIQKTNRLWTTWVITALMALMLVGYLLPRPQTFIAYGLRDRLLRSDMLDEMRHFAQEVDRMPPVGGNKSFSPEDLANTSLKQKHSFLSWAQGSSYVAESDGIVSVRWGGFVGLWGLNITATRGELSLPSSSKGTVVRVGKDIFVVSEPH